MNKMDIYRKVYSNELNIAFKADKGHNHDSTYSKLDHTHNYAGSDSVGGKATSAVLADKATVADKLSAPVTINKVAFDGTADIVVEDSTKLPLSGGNLSGQIVMDNNIIIGGKKTNGDITAIGAISDNNRVNIGSASTGTDIYSSDTINLKNNICINSGCSLVYDSTNQCINFVFN